MANKILTTVFDNHGNSYDTDVYVTHYANINNTNLLDLRINIVLSFYKNENYYISGYTQFQATKTNNPTDYLNVINQDITIEQAPLLNAIMIQQFVTSYLKGIYGEDNVITL